MKLDSTPAYFLNKTHSKIVKVEAVDKVVIVKFIKVKKYNNGDIHHEKGKTTISENEITNLKYFLKAYLDGYEPSTPEEYFEMLKSYYQKEYTDRQAFIQLSSTNPELVEMKKGLEKFLIEKTKELPRASTHVHYSYKDIENLKQKYFEKEIAAANTLLKKIDLL